MKTLEEWDLESEAIMNRLDKEYREADTPAKALPVASKGLAFAARNYVTILENGSDGSGASMEDAVRRAMRALEDGARLFAAVELRTMAQGCPSVAGHGDCDHCVTCEDAAEFLEEHSAEIAEGDERARQGS